MGKLKALRLRITKGVVHYTESINPKKVIIHKAIDRATARLRCNECGHASNAHTRPRAPYEGVEGEALFMLIKDTQDKTTGGFSECRFYYCNVCEEKK